MSPGSPNGHKDGDGGLRLVRRREMTGWEKQIGALNLIVGDLERSTAFYRDVFGQPVQHQDEDTAMFRFKDTYLFLQRGSAHEDAPAAEVLDLAEKRVGQFVFIVDDVDAVRSTRNSVQIRIALAAQAANAFARKPDGEQEGHDRESPFLVPRDPRSNALETDRRVLRLRVRVEDERCLHGRRDEREDSEDGERLSAGEVRAEGVDTGGDHERRVDPDRPDEERPYGTQLSDPRHPAGLLRKLAGASRSPRPQT